MIEVRRRNLAGFIEEPTAFTCAFSHRDSVQGKLQGVGVLVGGASSQQSDRPCIQRHATWPESVETDGSY